MASVSKRSWTHNGVRKEAWTVRYFDETGVRRSKQWETKKQADAHKRKVEREIEDGIHVVDAEAATVAEMARLYLDNAEQRAKDGRLSETRVYDLRCVFRNHLIPRLGNRRLKDLQPGDVDKTYRALCAAGLSPMSARHALQELGTMERYAFRHGATRTTPIGIGLSDLRGIKGNVIGVPTQDEATKLLRIAIGYRFKIRKRAAALLACAVHLAGCCGLRSGEIVGLRWENVDLTSGELRIRTSLSRFAKVKGTKSAAGVRNVPLPRHIVEMLSAWSAEHAQNNVAGLVFTNIANKPVKGERLRSMWYKLLKEADLYTPGDPFHFHSLRHFAASWWIECGLSLPEVATMLGHAKVDMTLSVYAHSLVRPHARAEKMEVMASLLTQAPALTDARVTHGA